MKTCTKCDIEKPLSEFNFRKDTNNYRLQCKVCIGGKNKENRLLNKEKISVSKKEKYFIDRETILEKMKQYYTKNKTKIQSKSKSYYQKNKKIINKKTSIERKLKYKNNKLFALKENIRTNLNKVFRTLKIRKKNKTIEILGCSFDEFKTYLESKFETWMCWDNYGKYNGELNCGWDIDHIIPISTAKTEDDIIRLNHYTNLQPLCSYHNRNIKRGVY